MSILKRKSTASRRDDRMKELRDQLWPDADRRVWDYKGSKGWLNIPRSMPVIMRIMDSITKGQPVSATYLELWCRTYNNGFVYVGNPREMAFFSGFDGERAQRTWQSRIKSLQDLGFIDVKEGSSGPYSYILVENPYLALKNLRASKKISDVFWNALMARMIETGSNDISEKSED